MARYIESICSECEKPILVKIEHKEQDGPHKDFCSECIKGWPRPLTKKVKPG